MPCIVLSRHESKATIKMDIPPQFSSFHLACLITLDTYFHFLRPRALTPMTRTLLHVGCGPQRKSSTSPGFQSDDWQELRLDIDARVEPDLIGTMTNMSAVADASIDAIYSSHNIEHLYPHEVPLALAEFRHVLKPDGFAIITCPDLQSVCALVANGQLTDPAYISPAGPISPLDILYGLRSSMAQGNLYMSHRSGFTDKTMNDALRAAGFPIVASVARPESYDIWAIASNSTREEKEIRDLARQYFRL